MIKRNSKDVKEYIDNSSANTIGEKIKLLRLKNSLSQGDIARLVGVTQSTVSWWECNRHTISASNLFKLSKVLKVPIGYFQESKETTNNIATIGGRIRDIRTSWGMSTKDLANALSVDVSNINYWENNKVCPNVESILKISEYFGIATDYLLKGE